MWRWMIGLAFAALAGCIVVPIPIPISTQPTPVNIHITPATSGFGLKLVQIRAQYGLGPVEKSPILENVAREYAKVLATDNNGLVHRDAEGKMPWDRATAAGYCSGYVVENLAWGQTSEDQVLRDWMNSEGHRDNILNPRVHRFGLGNSGTYWVLLIGTAC